MPKKTHFEDLRESLDDPRVLIAVYLHRIDQRNFSLRAVAEWLNNVSKPLRGKTTNVKARSHTCMIGWVDTHGDLTDSQSLILVLTGAPFDGCDEALPNTLNKLRFRERLFFLLRLDRIHNL